MKTNDQKIESLENDVKFEILRLEDEDNVQNAKLENLKQGIQAKFAEAKVWMKDERNKEEVKERLEALKTECYILIGKTKEEFQKFQNREDVQAGKQKLQETGAKLTKRIGEGIDKAMEHETVVKAVHTITDKVEAVQQDERVQKSIKSLKKSTLKAAELAYMGLKRMLDTDEEDDKKG